MSTQQPFIHLQCHSEFSLLEGAVRISKLIDRCEELNMPAVALTDNGTMFGSLGFYLKARAKGINPIIGCELYVTPDINEKVRARQRLIILCKNFEGYQNLIHLVSISHVEGFYYKPRIDLNHLKKYTEGLFVISPGGYGPVAQHLRDNNDDAAKAAAVELKEIYGDSFYLGVQKCDLPFEELINQGTLDISKACDIPLVATNDVFYLNEDQAILKDVLSCIQKGKVLDGDLSTSLEVHHHYLKTSDEMYDLLKEFPEAYDNTYRIASQCNVEIKTDQVTLPNFECPDQKTPEVYLRDLVMDGVRERYDTIDKRLQERIDFELNIINKMQYAPYFLIIFDFLDFCYSEKIPVGPGRGSAAGSIVAYALGITNIDPIRYKLLFERFLNPERVSMPDIDLDFCIRRRQEVIDYLVRRYGEERVSQIATFGTMAARGVVRDVGRALDVPLSDVDRVAKLIPSAPGKYTSIPEALEEVPELKKWSQESEEINQLLQMGIQLEGMARHTSTHAAGVVISRDPLHRSVPMMKNDGQVSTQYAMSDVEKVGLLKMDILGLRNLTVIDDAVKLIKNNHGVSIDLNALSVEDEPTYDLLCTGNTAGIFQLESRGMRQLIKDLKPRLFEDIIALLALYRPGPLGSGMVQDFISNKSGKTDVKYDLPELEPILKDTYGMILYQEQVMQIASVIGGFSLGQADMLRRAMGKKKKDVMDAMKQDFLDGAKEKGFPLKKASHIFELCYKFAEYGFNKSHSAAYALISFQTAYLKANFPMEYMASLLSSVLGNADKTALYIQECKDLGIEILPPNVNESQIDFTIVPSQTESDQKVIRFGLRAIKNVGDGAIESIIENQSKDEPFRQLSQFLQEVDLRQVNKRVVESLIKSGAMDHFGDRSALLAIYERCIESAQVLAKERDIGQTSLFSTEETQDSFFEQLPKPGEYTKIPQKKLLEMEKELLGLYISGHPLDAVIDKLNSLEFNSKTIRPENDKEPVAIAGLLKECRRITTRTKKQMLLGKCEDLHGELTVLMFENDRFEEYADVFIDDRIVLINGRIRVNQDEISIMAEKIELIEKSRMNRNLFIDVQGIDDEHVFKMIKETCESFAGSTPVYFKLGDVTILSNRKYWIAEDPVCIAQLESIVGAGLLWIA